jgi:hypothetical protein
MIVSGPPIRASEVLTPFFFPSLTAITARKIASFYPTLLKKFAARQVNRAKRPVRNRRVRDFLYSRLLARAHGVSRAHQNSPFQEFLHFLLRKSARAFLGKTQPHAGNRAFLSQKKLNPKSLSRLTTFWWTSLFLCL